MFIGMGFSCAFPKMALGHEQMIGFLAGNKPEGVVSVMLADLAPIGLLFRVYFGDAHVNKLVRTTFLHVHAIVH
jgi:hypothetical protein